MFQEGFSFKTSILNVLVFLLNSKTFGDDVGNEYIFLIDVGYQCRNSKLNCQPSLFSSKRILLRDREK